MVSSGFAEEFAGIDFGDKRLSKRVVRIAERLGRFCHASIPAAADGRAEMEAIYRFVGNAKVSPPKLTSQHRRATLERTQQCDVVLLVQDTTELEVTRPSEQVNGAGPLTHDSRRGESSQHSLPLPCDRGCQPAETEDACDEEVSPQSKSTFAS